MLRSMTARQLDEWRMFEQLEPFAVERSDWHFASIVGALSNIHRGKNKAAKPTSAFRLQFGDDKPVVKQQTWQEQKAIMQQHFKLMDLADAARERKKLAVEKRRELSNERRERRRGPRETRTRK